LSFVVRERGRSRITGETWNDPSGQVYALSYAYDAAGNRAWKDIDGTLTYYTGACPERTRRDAEGRQQSAALSFVVRLRRA